jgi:formylglycine-generating enzyme required for sulfatase activity
MAGNVFEWCYNNTAGGDNKAVRGGAFNYGETYQTATYRTTYAPQSNTYNTVGLRVVRPTTEVPPARPEVPTTVEKELIRYTGTITPGVYGDFYMGKYEITQLEWQTVMTPVQNNISNAPSYFNGTSGRTVDAGEQQPRRPVENISWYAAIVFCNRLSVKDGLTPAYEMQASASPNAWTTDTTLWGNVGSSTDSRWSTARIVAGATGYRLPSRDQWVYAYRAWTLYDCYWGYTSGYSPYAWARDNSNTKTHEVGKKQPNAFGLYDMAGNVREWSNDAYSSSTRYISGSSWSDSYTSTHYNLHVNNVTTSIASDWGMRVMLPAPRAPLVEVTKE